MIWYKVIVALRQRAKELSTNNMENKNSAQVLNGLADALEAGDEK